jgi:hypothetical protein
MAGIKGGRRARKGKLTKSEDFETGGITGR